MTSTIHFYCNNEHQEHFVLKGSFFGSQCEPNFIQGEIVFTTGMTGIIETLTDPSYCNQIVVFTFPPFGNYHC